LGLVLVPRELEFPYHSRPEFSGHAQPSAAIDRRYADCGYLICKVAIESRGEAFDFPIHENAAGTGNL
jgi:hypothetical protein